MLFVEPRFFVFFAIVFALYWSLKRNTQRKVVLLVASYIFYGAWDPRFTALLAFSTLFDYGAGLAMEAASSGRRRKLIILFSVSVNLTLLFTFKYFNFFADSFVGLLHAAGVQANPVTVRLILPVGISFYTFQSLSYTLDIYRGHMPARRSLLDYATFVGFFPQLVAGPIVRAYDFLPQLDELKRFSAVAVRPAVILFFFGYVKKACVSDNVAPYVDMVFSHPGSYSGASIVAATVLYAIQIYCDFSGYTDMAIATAKLLGYDLTVNFRHPYFSTSISDFWRRWHISLSSWLRDYLYIPLGGNRDGRLGAYRNLMITMVLGGLWHGASWNFVIWGTLHGGALILHKEYARHRPAAWTGQPAYQAGAMLLTFWWVCLAWIFFRSTSLPLAAEIARDFVTMSGTGAGDIATGAAPAILGLLLIHALESRRLISGALLALERRAFYALAGAASGAALALTPIAYRPFIYFQF
ncbi:membrane-bound O-acyltransferase family protein [Aliidongia dinghuensis]|uniref:Probable alginate O-acetylase AlgI n=1 Tax=Aliidongia dinghuensis TaxID=1867774 RepID=A0A8J3E404_9PROT|nr:MBOAT family protein [Aliidongia dinghuensis]GGF10519.1 membrane-bound O-acyltransferase family protein [Aliidongia dinghuensis]